MSAEKSNMELNATKADDQFISSVYKELLYLGLGQSPFSKVYCFGKVSSTMDIARHLQSENAESELEQYKILDIEMIEELNELAFNTGAIILAEEQTAGKGRGGSEWYSEPNTGLYISLVLKPESKISTLTGVSIIAGISVCKALRTFGVESGIKWPNDVVVSGTDEIASKKLCGILVESSIQDGLTKNLTIGIGVNVSQSEFPPEIPAESISSLLGKEVDRDKVLSKILEYFFRDYLLLLKQGFKPFISEWREHSVLISSRVKINVQHGPDFFAPLEGTVVGLNEDGALLVEEVKGKEPVAVYNGEFLEIRPGATAGVSVRQALNQILAETDSEETTQEFVEAFEEVEPLDEELLSDDETLSKDLGATIRDMELPQKVKLGMLGGKPARKILIRDANRLVKAAVMKNPRLSEPEIIDYGKNPNTDDQVLRTIVKNKTWMKNYLLKVAVVSNPKSPLDISVKWLKHLKDKDLKNLSRSKGIPSALVSQCRKLVELRAKK